MPEEISVIKRRPNEMTPRAVSPVPKASAPASTPGPTPNKSTKAGTVIAPVPTLKKAPKARTALSSASDGREKVLVTLELDSDLAAHLKEAGSDWQQQVNNLLRKTMV